MKKKYRYSKMERKERMTSLLFASPMIIKTIVFTVCCLIFAVYFSFTDYNIMNYCSNGKRTPKCNGNNFTEIQEDA